MACHAGVPGAGWVAAALASVALSAPAAPAADSEIPHPGCHADQPGARRRTGQEGSPITPIRLMNADKDTLEASA